MAVQLPVSSSARPTNRAQPQQAADAFAGSARGMFVALGLSVACALMFPFPATKVVLGVVLGLLYLKYLNDDMALGLAIVAFSVPVQDLTPHALLLIPGANIATVVMLLLVLFWWKHEAQSKESSPPFSMRLPLAAFIALCVLSILQSWLFQDKTLGYLLTLLKAQFAFVLLALIAFRSLGRRQQRMLVFGTVIAISTLVSLHAVLSYGAGIRERSAGLIGGQPNLFGGFLAMQIPFVIALGLCRQVSGRVRLMAGASALVMIQALVLTGSRGAWLAFAIGLTLLALVADRRALVVLLVGYLLVPVFFYGFSEDRLQSLSQILTFEPGQREEDQSLEYRISVWRNVGSLITAPYVVGRGYATSDDAMRDLGITDQTKATHSSIISLAIEWGLVGVVIYIWLLIALWMAARRCLKQSGNGLALILGTGFTGAIPALIVCDISGSRFHNGEIMAFFWLLSGLLLREASEIKQSSPGVGHNRVSGLAPARLR